MARVPAEELERLKREVSVQRLAEARGIKLTRHGKDLHGLCPFHNDNEPSLVISPEKNLWHCLGECQAGGSVVDWVMKAEGVSFRHAVELLRADLPAAGTSVRRVKLCSVPKLPAPVAQDASDDELLRQVVGYYHETLKASPEALAYLEGRGLGHPELVDHFRLGLANRTLGLRLPEKSRRAGAELRGRLEAVGVYRASGHEHFNGCIVFPVFDEAGRVVEMYGRKITPRLKPDIPLHLYLPGPHRGVFNLEGIVGAKEVILCEALIDALTFWCAGFRHVTASYGIEGFTEDHLTTFQRYGVERVLIAYDRDAAGDNAAAKLAERLKAAGIAPFRVLFPKGQDANEYALKVKPAEKSLGLVLRHATWLGEGPAPALAVHQPPAEASAEASAPPPPPEPQPDPPLAAGREVGSPSGLPLPPAGEGRGEGSPPPRGVPVPAEIRAGEVVITLGDRRYRVRGLEKNLSYEQLRLNILSARGEAFHVDTLDLYSARQRAAYVKAAAEELRVKEEILKKDLGQVLLKLEELQDEQIKKTLSPEAPKVELSAAEKAAALELLSDPRLLDRLLADFARCGVVGEETNKLIGYLAAISRKLEEPLAVIVQSSSAAGKSSLMEAILALVPEEERVSYSAMTGQALFYMGGADLKHKILAIAEEEGAERASYALKLLQSEGELTIASTGKDPHSGRLVTHEYKVEGPVAIFLTTTAAEVDEELLNRCLVLSVDEERGQTRAIHDQQREAQTLEGLLAREEREEVLKLHQNAQRLLQPLAVVNPFARELTFLDARTRTRRDHGKYLTLMRSLALLFQHQREIKTVEHRGRTLSYIEVTLDDIEHANRLAHEVLGRSLDELPPQARKLLTLLDAAVAAECRAQSVRRDGFLFSRRWVRAITGWTDFQVRMHLDKLVALEYVLVHRGGRGQSFVYELLYDGRGQEGEPFLSGLIDVEALRAKLEAASTAATSRGPEGHFEGSSSPHRAPFEPPLRGRDIAEEAEKTSSFLDSSQEISPKARLGRADTTPVVGTGASRTESPLPFAARAAGG